MAATSEKKRDFYNNLFDTKIDLPDSRQIIDDVPTTVDIFIDEDLFSDEDIEDDSKQIIDNILKDINHIEILIQCEPTTTTTTTIQKEPESLNSKDILLAKRKKKKSLLLASSEAISKKY